MSDKKSNLRGSIRTYTDDEVKEIAEKYEKYIETAEIPIVAEFAWKNKISRNVLYDYPELSTLTKECIAKKESQLEAKSLKGEVNTTQAIFSLKQLGWSDRQDIKVDSTVKVEDTATLDDKVDIIKKVMQGKL